MHQRPTLTPAPTRLAPRRSTGAPHVAPVRQSSPRPPRKNRRRGGFWKSSIVVISAILLTTLASKASDSFKVADVLQLAGVGQSNELLRCPPEMAYVPTSQGGFCIDRFEVSTGKTCPFKTPTSAIQTNENIAVSTCEPDSVKGGNPWVNLSETQAMTLCAKNGKRLPTPGEWYRAALGTPDTITNRNAECAIGLVGSGSALPTGSRSGCVSSFGAYDMVGNVWEWVDADVREGSWKGGALPAEGYIAGVDSDGVPTETGTSSPIAFNGDYFFVEPIGVRGMFRGGYWGIDDTAGIYTINATIEHNFAGNAVGFRCVK